MGISGLLPLLKKASKNSHVRNFSGCTAAIDAYGWLHKGAFGCAQKLGMGEPTTAYITYCMKYIQVLLDNGVKPILVLDGRNLPSKEHTEKQRRKKRDENKKLARKYIQEGKKKEAWECFTRCVDITPAMAREFIKVLRTMKIDYVVAPYEADAQLAYLALTGVADIIITEDSDLVLFGCPKIFFKMNVNGDGVFYELSKLPQCFGQKPSTFSFERFRWMCILSGCDYLPSIPGIGLGRAKKIIDESKHDDIRKMILSIPSILVKVQVEVTEEYIAGFIQAENTFLYQLVFDTMKRTLLPLNPYPEGLGPNDLPFAGSYDTANIATDLALGNVDLHTLQTVDSFEPLKSGYPKTSIWSSSYCAGAKIETKVPPESIGMQISGGSKSSSKKKRPLAVVNSDNEDNALDDNELMKMYEEKKPTLKRMERGSSSRQASVSQELYSSEDDDEKKMKLETDSPSSAKRRRITQNTERNGGPRGDSSPSCNTRSRNRVVPFLKSPPAAEDSKKKIFVKSKYFRTAEEDAAVKRRMEKKIAQIKKEDEDEESSESEEDAAIYDLPPLNLNIYSQSQYSLSSEGEFAFSDSAPSQRSSSYGGSQSSVSDNTLAAAAGLKPCSVVFKKTDKVISQEITLDDDEEEDEAYGSGGGSDKINVSNGAPLASSSSNNQFSPSLTKTSQFDSLKLKSSCRRQGLSRSVKKDPKQPSIRDMFGRHKSVQ